MKFRFHQDDGHGWLEVGQDLLERHGLMGQISRYSRLQGGVAYLEEDCDAPRLIRALRDAGIDCEFEEVYHPGFSRIRDLPQFVFGLRR